MSKTPDIDRRRLVVATSQTSPRGTGRVLKLEITLYEGGHSAVNSVPHTKPVMSNDDLELISQLVLLIRNTRKQL